MRDQWEKTLLEGSEQAFIRENAIRTLNKLLENAVQNSDGRIAHDLIHLQNRFLNLHPSPEQGGSWLRMQIEDRWDSLIGQGNISEDEAAVVRSEIDVLKKSLYLGEDPELLAAYDKLPEGLRSEWVDLLYRNTDVFSLQRLNRLIKLLDDNRLMLPHKEKVRESLIRLKASAEIFGQLEEKTNLVLREVLNGRSNDIM